MDNLCHGLVGFAAAEAGLKRYTRFGTAALVISANLPDVDALVLLTDVPMVEFRRGWTHGVLAQALLPLLFTALLVWWDRLRPARAGALRARGGALLLLSYLGLLSHVFLDYLNTYGIRLLMPFSGRWFYGDTLFIIDPWLWLVFGIGATISRVRHTPWPARAGLAISAMYIAGMMWSAGAARAIVLDRWVETFGEPPPQLMVGPEPVTPFEKQIIVDAGEGYLTGEFDWTPRNIRFDMEPIRKNDDHPAVVRAREHRQIRGTLVWARFPYFLVTPGRDATRVTLRDVRFGDRVGGVSVVVPDDP